MVSIHPAIHKHLLRNYFLHGVVGLVFFAIGARVMWSGMEAAGSVLFNDSMNYPTGLITNEYAHWNPTDPTSKFNANWDMTSGSLFAQNGSAWSGVPDDTVPNATSSAGTDSAIFRLNTKRFDFGNVLVNFNLFQNGFTSTPATPAVAWDGVHIFLRYQTEYYLYYASVNRRDGSVVIKKKCPGGPSNGGTYYELGPGEVPGHPIPWGVWQSVGATVQNNADGSVTIGLLRDGIQVISATDSGIGCPVIRSAGATGIRGDNDNFLFNDFSVTSLAAATPTPSAAQPSNAPTGGSSQSSSAKATPLPATAEPEPADSRHPAASTGQSSSTEPHKAATPSPLSPGAIMLAAQTQPTAWAGLLTVLLSALLAYAAFRRHFRLVSSAKIKRGRRKL